VGHSNGQSVRTQFATIYVTADAKRVEIPRYGCPARNTTTQSIGILAEEPQATVNINTRGEQMKVDIRTKCLTLIKQRNATRASQPSTRVVTYAGIDSKHVPIDAACQLELP
jgi:hypothetical protein